MTVRFPLGRLTSKHIHYKLTVWKKHYGVLLGMLATSGFGWNYVSCTISVDEDVWEKYARTHTDVSFMRHKSFPFYESWLEIFGKFRATGEHAQCYTETVEDEIDINNYDGPGDGTIPLHDSCKDLSDEIATTQLDNMEEVRKEITHRVMTQPLQRS